MEFVPPFCPKKCCPTNQNPSLRQERWYRPNGFRTNRGSGTVRRFICRHCLGGFSSRTFSVDYWTHQAVPYHPLQSMLIAGAGIRQTARFFGVAPKVVANRYSRLARQSIALQAKMLEHFELNDSLVFDGFESFATSQYFPNNINLLVTKKSQFVVAMNATLLRRRGRMTEAQKEKRTTLEHSFRAPANGIYITAKEMIGYGCDLALVSKRLPIVIDTDEKKEYSWALSRIAPYGSWVQHGLVVHTRTNSKKSRTTHNPLFAVNYLDRQLRKDLSEHVRETVRFARRIEQSLERLSIHLAHHNYFKSFRVNGKDRKLTHAEVAGFSRNAIETWREFLFSERAFGWRVPLEPWQTRIWKRDLKVPIYRSAALPRHLDTV